ncbi:unnamed protein product [Phytophthora fragariaefolia]|uniref:Unnamed protein product n=1 Tax=Phytophthora fragariaefolia TaxID=1490495 RepID=A0A9W6Y8F6_9STRA|nr:unnamed protein product [Phytophthora fragariaefolia]
MLANNRQYQSVEVVERVPLMHWNGATYELQISRSNGQRRQITLSATHESVQTSVQLEQRKQLETQSSRPNLSRQQLKTLESRAVSLSHDSYHPAAQLYNA